MDLERSMAMPMRQWEVHKTALMYAKKHLGTLGDMDVHWVGDGFPIRTLSPGGSPSGQVPGSRRQRLRRGAVRPDATC